MEGGRKGERQWVRPAVFNALVSGGIMRGSAEVHEMGSGATRAGGGNAALRRNFHLSRLSERRTRGRVEEEGDEGLGLGGGGGGGARWKINGVISCWRRKVGLNPGREGGRRRGGIHPVNLAHLLDLFCLIRLPKELVERFNRAYRDGCRGETALSVDGSL